MYFQLNFQKGITPPPKKVSVILCQQLNCTFVCQNACYVTSSETTLEMKLNRICWCSVH
jgi:hypothetical protein